MSKIGTENIFETAALNEEIRPAAIEVVKDAIRRYLTVTLVVYSQQTPAFSIHLVFTKIRSYFEG